MNDSGDCQSAGDCQSPGDFRPSADWPGLRLRAGLLRRLREFFHENDFLEVETPLLGGETVVDRHLEPFEVDCRGRRMWLQTSPEFAMKRMLSAGAEAIYQVAHSFRQGESGPLHNPEFTIVEWYRAGDSMEDGMRFTGQLCQALLDCDQAETLSYGEAFERHVGLDPHTAGSSELIAAVRKHDIQSPDGLAADDRDAWLDLLLVELVQPNLGVERPLLLYDYPASQAALARIRNDEPPVAERFELYISGIELANGYNELLDADELLERNRRVNQQRREDGNRPLPDGERLLSAMRSGMPASVGVALGFDRLVMLAAGAKDIAQVMPFPVERA